MIMKPRSFCFLLKISLLIIVMHIPDGEASAEWLFYDTGSADNPGSSFKFQGVRFSLPEETVKAPLQKISFHYSCSGSCPVTIHITNHDRKTRLINPIDYTAVNGWNEIDVSGFALLVPHSFYVILERHGTGCPSIDNETSAGRSFKGTFLASMNTLLSHNLLVRAEIGPAVVIPVLKKFDSVVTETTKVNIQGNAPEKLIRTFSAKWTLFSDGTFMTENYVYGTWRQKGRKLLFSYDPEDIVNLLKDMPYGKMTVSVAKISFSGMERKDRTIKGAYKIYAGAHFHDYNSVGKILIEGKFVAAPDE
jgi:hypothetical protein